ncbi:hypothetical protein FRC17_001366 [Serendipita sp. 399]|nr:hypothetical protein FRC17_001366 [Serendipita sp. 399]
MLRRLRLSSPIPLTYPASQLFNTIHLLEWDVYLKENQDDIRRSLSAVLKQCIQLVDFATRVVHWRSSSDPMKQIVQEIMTEHPLKELRTITYFIPVAKKFEADEILETVTLASH